MRAGRAAGHAAFADHLPAPDMIADRDVDMAQMEEGRIEPHAVADHQQMPLQREGLPGRGEENDAVGGRTHRRARRHRDVLAGVVTALLAIIDALRTERARDAPDHGPLESLPPAVADQGRRLHARGVDLIELAFADLEELRLGLLIFGDRQRLDPVGAGRDDETIDDGRAIAARRHQRRARAVIAAEGDQEATVGRQRDIGVVERQRDGAGRHGADEHPALAHRAAEGETMRRARRCRRDRQIRRRHLRGGIAREQSQRGAGHHPHRPQDRSSACVESSADA